MRRLRRGGGWFALAACLLVVALAGCELAAESDGDRLGRDLGEAIEGRAKCRPYAAPERWTCAVESDPGSGWSGPVHLKVYENGCWRARHVKYVGSQGSRASRSDLSFGDFQANGGTLKGCTDLGGNDSAPVLAAGAVHLLNVY